MVRPTISVIIATYNAARFLTEAIDSALAQEGGIPTEIVVVDDGSTDGSSELLRRYGERVRSVRQRNAGPSSARNHGVRLARGRWLAFLDADDVWRPDKLRRQLARAQAQPDEPVDLVYSDRESFGEGPAGRLSDVMSLPEGRIFPMLLLRNFITLSSVLMRRDVFLRVGGFCEELPGAEDWDLWLRYGSQRAVGVCPEPLVRYRRHENSLTRDPERMVGAHLKVVYRALALPPCRRWTSARIRGVLAKNWRVGGGYAERTRPPWAAACYLRSLMYDLAAPQAYRGLARAALRGLAITAGRDEALSAEAALAAASDARAPRSTAVHEARGQEARGRDASPYRESIPRRGWPLVDGPWSAAVVRARLAAEDDVRARR